MRMKPILRPSGVLLLGMMVWAQVACTENAPAPSSNGLTAALKLGHAEHSLAHGSVLAHFRGTVDLEHGTLSFESLTPSKVELVATRISKDAAECGAAQRLCSEVALRSLHAMPLRNIWVELVAMEPRTGFEAYNSSTSVPQGLQNRYGLFSYGDLKGRGDSNTARWGFNVAYVPGPKRFSFTGRVMAELMDSEEPIANAGPDQDVFDGDTVQLDGSGSSDPQQRPVTYRWTLVSKPADSTAVLAQANTATPTFVTDKSGPYVLELVVNNGVMNSLADSITVNSVFRNTISVTSLSLLTSSSGTMKVTLGSPALPGGQTVNLASNDALIATVPASVFIEAGQRSATFTVTTGTRSGSATVTAFAPDFFDGTGSVTVNNRRMTLLLSAPLVGVNRELPGTLTLTDPAPAGGVTVSPSTSANNMATLSPSSIIFAPGQATADVTVSGLAEGRVTFRAQAPGYSDATANVTVTASSTLNLPAGMVVAPDQTLSFPISLSAPAPAGGLLAQLTSSAPGVVSVTPSVLIPEGATAPSVQPTVTGVTLGSATVTATGTGYAPDTRTVDVRLSMNFAPTSIAMPVDNSATLVLSLSAPAPTGGVTVDLRTDNAARATVPATVTFAAGQSQANVTVTGVSVGTTVLRATGVGLNQATANVTVNPAPAISLSNVTVGKDLVTSSSGSLAAPAPAGNLQVTLTSADPSKVLLAKTQGEQGSGSITVEVGAGKTSIPVFYIHGLDGSGSVQLIATAPNYARGLATMTLRPSGFYFTSLNISTTSLSANSQVSIATAMLDPVTFALGTQQPLRPGVTASVTVSSSNSAVGDITVSPVIFNPGDSSRTTAFDPISGGTTTLALTQPVGFMAPSSKTQLTATVTAPDITLGNKTIGKDLQVGASASLDVAAPAGNAQLTLTVADPAKALLSTSPTAVGTPSLTFTIFAGSRSTPTFYVQALAGSGTVQYTASAPGYNSKTATLTLTPSGAILRTCTICGETSFGTTTFSNNTPLVVMLGQLNPTTLNFGALQELRPGVGPVSVDVTSSDNGVGTLTASPVVINANQGYSNTAFNPSNAGTTELVLSTPEGFSKPSNYQQLTATVTAPDITLGNKTIGKDLQVGASASLDVAAPAGNAQLTLTVADPAKALLSTSPTAVGTPSLTFTIFAGSRSTPTFYVQALAGSGTVQYTASAPGYNSKTATLTLTPSGVILRTCTICGETSFSTTVSSSNTALVVMLGQLNPTTLNFGALQGLRPGVGPVSVGVTSSDNDVGTLTASPVVINANQDTASTAFDPQNVGTTELVLSTPEGFSKPSNYQKLIATVTSPAPDISLPNRTIGKNLQVSSYASLTTAAPAGGVILTITVDPTQARLSASPEVYGTSGTLVFNIAAGSKRTPDFYVQALAGSGSVSYTASASGYTTKTATLSFYPSGFVITGFGTSFTTTTSASDTTLKVYPAALDPFTLNLYATQQLRPGLSNVVVPVISSDPSVGTITLSPVVFIGADEPNYRTTSFHPVAAGQTTLVVSAPAGFSEASNNNHITAYVSQ